MAYCPADSVYLISRMKKSGNSKGRAGIGPHTSARLYGTARTSTVEARLLTPGLPRQRGHLAMADLCALRHLSKLVDLGIAFHYARESPHPPSSWQSPNG
jgi:hypothetical protein